MSYEAKKRGKHRAARSRRARASQDAVIKLALLRTLGVVLNVLAIAHETGRAAAAKPKEAA